MIEIKKLKKEDTSLASNLFKGWRNQSIIKGTEQTKKLNRLQIKERLSDENFHVFIAIQDETIVGGLTAYTLPLVTRIESKIFLYELEVQAKFRKKGIGSRLIKELKAFCRKKGIKTIFLCTELENEGAQKLYKKMGGEQEIVLMYHFKLS